MEMEKAGIQGEMMSDAFEMLEDPSAATDAEDVYNGILGEIGLEYTSGAAAVPTNSLAQPAQAQAAASPLRRSDPCFPMTSLSTSWSPALSLSQSPPKRRRAQRDSTWCQSFSSS